MARPREHLRNAPIVEAVIDFRVVRQEQVSAETFANLGSFIGGQYTNTGSIQSIEARFHARADIPVKALVERQGKRIWIESCRFERARL